MPSSDALASELDALDRNDLTRALAIARRYMVALGHLPASVVLYLGLMQDDDDELQSGLVALGAIVSGAEL